MPSSPRRCAGPCARRACGSGVTLVEDLRRETMIELLQLNDVIDLAIPRGWRGPDPFRQ